MERLEGYEMGNILQKPTETVYIVVLLVYLSYISVSCSQTVDEEQGLYE